MAIFNMFEIIGNNGGSTETYKITIDDGGEGNAWVASVDPEDAYSIVWIGASDIEEYNFAAGTVIVIDTRAGLSTLSIIGASSGFDYMFYAQYFTDEHYILSMPPEDIEITATYN